MKTPMCVWYGTLSVVLMGMMSGVAAAGAPDDKSEREHRAVKAYLQAAAAANPGSSAGTLSAQIHEARRAVPGKDLRRDGAEGPQVDLHQRQQDCHP